MKTCIHCGAEITEPKKRLYCSHTCYERYNSKKKYRNNIIVQRERAKVRNAKPETKARHSSTIKEHKKWVKEQGLTITNYVTYGYTFLKENPEVVAALLVANSIIKSKMTRGEIREYKKEYYKKNRDLLCVKAKVNREKNKLKNNLSN